MSAPELTKAEANTIITAGATFLLMQDLIRELPVPARDDLMKALRRAHRYTAASGEGPNDEVANARLVSGLVKLSEMLA